jgi:hypothetical protein
MAIVGQFACPGFGTFETYRQALRMSVDGGGAEVAGRLHKRRF